MASQQEGRPLRDLLVAVAVIALAPAAASAADLPGIQTAGALRVIVAADEDKATFDPRGGASPGFERELVDTFARVHGLRLEPVIAKSSAERLTLLLGGKGDLVVAIFDTPERRKQVAFTAEVMPTYSVAVTLAPRPPLKTVDALRQEKVGVIKGAVPADEAAAAGVASLQRFETLPEMLAALHGGRIGALVLPISEFVLASKSDRSLQAGATVGETRSVAWAVRKEDTALLAALDEHLANVRRSAAWNLLLVKYFGEQAPVVLRRRSGATP
jgi:ABC-type amino acid transport substrate-binding protein